jgi:two-component system, NarL family, invasion response regulator UvrY
MRLLLIDDHAMFREGLKQILAKQSDMNMIDETGNGHEALDKMRMNEYQVVILDLSMPGRSGWDILSEIKAEHPTIPVIILSMHPEDQYAIRMLRAGAAGYITKESDTGELLAAIRKVAKGGKYVSPLLAEKLAETVAQDSTRMPHQILSNREFQVLCFLASGKSLKEIADELCLSEKTITTYRARIMEKMQLRNNVELTHYAIQHKLIER